MSVSVLFSMIFNYFLILLVLACWICIIIILVKNKRASVISIKAVVADKYKTRAVSKMSSAFAQEKYTIVFSTADKKLAFNVSEFSYTGYNIGESGTLKYKGHKIIEFS